MNQNIGVSFNVEPEKPVHDPHSGGSEEHGHHSSHVHIPSESLVMMFIVLCLVISAFAKHFQKRYNVT